MNGRCTIARKKANMTLGLISRNFDHKSQEVMKRPDATFVRLHLAFWSPSYIKKQNLLVIVQRQATEHISYT